VKKQLLIIIALLCMMAQGSWALSFITHGWDDTEKKVTTTHEELHEGDYTELSGSHASDWVTLETEGKYVVTENASYKVLNVTGTNVHLYLCDGVTMNLKHIKLESGKSLHIHAQSNSNSNFGKLIVKNDDFSGAAGIGGGDGANAGDLYIHGGEITVTANDYAAGIGGGDGGQGGSLYVYDGVVTANGGTKAAGIGGGQNNYINKECSINIYGGTVKAYGNGQYDTFGYYKAGAGIGGGDKGEQGGDVNIYGGDVTAEAKAWGASGIGGGYEGNGGKVNISGGKVTAIGYYQAGAGIGPGVDAQYNSIINITGGTVDASGTIGIRGTTTISNATVICTTLAVSGISPFIGELTFGDDFAYKVTKGSYRTTWEETPVAYTERNDACFTKENNYSVKIEPCEKHHYVDYVCSYCGKEYYETATDTWADEGIRAEEFSAIDETNKTITITNEAELALFEYNISHNGGNTYEEWTINVSKDLDMSEHKWGAKTGTFKGIFDGQGHTISGLNYPKDNRDDAGLFAHNSGTIKNVQLANSIIVGKRYVGGIAGENTGTVENCYVDASVSVTNSDYSDDSKGCGGVVGLQIQNPFATDVTAVTRGCYSEASVNSADYVGGIIGHMKEGTRMEDCVSKATINLKSSDGNKGVLAGVAESGATFENNGYISETIIDNANGTRLINVSLSDDLTTADHRLNYGGPINKSYNVSGIKFYYEPQVTINGKWYAEEGKTFKFNIRGSQSDFTYNYVTVNGNEVESVGGDYTIEATDYAAKYVVDAAAWQGEGTQDNPWLISSTADWDAICKVLNKATASDAELFAGKYFKQTADIDITQGIGVTGNPNDKLFCGTYDGNNHKLNCSLTNPVSGSAEAVAPFHNTKGATFRNIFVTGTISGGIRTAGIVAYTHGDVTIDNCRVAADITCTGDQWADAHGAGFVGYSMDGKLTISNSLFDGSLTAVSNGKGNIRMGALIGEAGSSTTTDVRYCMENATYEGDGETAFCWTKDGSTDISVSSGNTYVSDLNYSSGAKRSHTVENGTEGLVLDFSNDNWTDTFAGSGKRQTGSGNHMIDDKFFAEEGSSVSFKVTYPENWNVTAIMANDEEATFIVDSYSFTQRTENTLITAQFTKHNWIKDGIAATEFSTIDEANKVVTITTPQELALLSKQVYNGNETGKDWTYKLGSDLDMSEYDWTPIGSMNGAVSDKCFMGIFDGQGHTISGINVPQDGNTFDAVGLFGNVVAGTVKNLKLKDCQFDGNRFIGGIVAYQNSSNVENCYVDGDVKLNPHSANAVCGGVTGYLAGSSKIKGCYSAAFLSKNDGVLYEYQETMVGGIAGTVNGPCEVTDNISQAVISKGTSENFYRGYIVGSGIGSYTNNYYIADEASTNSNDVRAFNVKMSSDLTSQGFDFTYDGDNTEYDISQVKMYDGQFLLNGKWYVPANGTFKFKLPTASSENLWLEWTDVKVNDGNVITPSAGVYSFDTTGDTSVEFEINATVIKGSPATDINNIGQSDNLQSDDAIYDLSGRKVSNGQMPKGIYIQNGKKVVIK